MGCRSGALLNRLPISLRTDPNCGVLSTSQRVLDNDQRPPYIHRRRVRSKFLTVVRLMGFAADRKPGLLGGASQVLLGGIRKCTSQTLVRQTESFLLHYYSLAACLCSPVTSSLRCLQPLSTGSPPRLQQLQVNTFAMFPATNCLNGHSANRIRHPLVRRSKCRNSKFGRQQTSVLSNTWPKQKRIIGSALFAKTKRTLSSWLSSPTCQPAMRTIRSRTC